MEDASIVCSLLTRKRGPLFFSECPAREVCVGNFLNTIQWECTTCQVLCLQTLIYLLFKSNSNNPISWTLLPPFHRGGEATFPSLKWTEELGFKPKPVWMQILDSSPVITSLLLYPQGYLENPYKTPVQFWIKIILVNNAFLIRHLISLLWNVTVSEKAVHSIWMSYFWMSTFLWIPKTKIADPGWLPLSPKIKRVWPC